MPPCPPSPATRRPTAPIPLHLVDDFYAAAWDVAARGVAAPTAYGEIAGGRYRDHHTLRRHGLSVLWLTACAMRFSELQRLQVRDVSAAGGSAFVLRSKGGLSGAVDVASALVTLTMRWRSERTRVFESPYLLANRRGGPLSNDNLNRDCCGLFSRLFGGLPLSSHCFRDTACQLAMSQSESVRVVQRLMGHRSARTTEHYLAKQSAASFRLRLFESAASDSSPPTGDRQTG